MHPWVVIAGGNPCPSCHCGLDPQSMTSEFTLLLVGRAQQRRARPGRGAMATASGIACLSQAPAGFPALNGLAARAKKLPALRSGQTVFASMKRGVASDAGPQDRPPRAPVLYSRRVPAMHGVAVTGYVPA